MLFKLRLRHTFLGGQSLIEVVVSIGIAVMLAISLITTSLITQKSSRSARNNSQATKLVQETMEQLRVFRDRKGFDQLPNSGTTVCVDLNADSTEPLDWTLQPIGPCPILETIPLNNTNFDRKIEIINDGANKRLITLTISWDESGQTRSVKSQTFLGLWQNFP